MRDLLAQGELFVHGTTTATNAIITGKTARTAFLTTAGHPDVLVLREGGRIGLPLFDYSIPYPQPYVPRALTFEVPERIGPSGEVIVAARRDGRRSGSIAKLGEAERRGGRRLSALVDRQSRDTSCAWRS